MDPPPTPTPCTQSIHIMYSVYRMHENAGVQSVKPPFPWGGNLYNALLALNYPELT